MTHRGRVLAFAVFLLAVPSFATTVIVPTDQPTIQGAVLAAQGTPGGTVIVQSNATFVETVTVTQSVVLEAGAGFSPSLEGAGPCGGIGGNCTLDLRPNVPGPQIAVRGLRILPGTNPTDLVKIENQSADAATIELTGLTLLSSGNDPIRGVTIRSSGAANDVTIHGGSITVGGTPKFPTTGIDMTGAGDLKVDGLVILTLDGTTAGFSIDGPPGRSTFTMTGSQVTVTAPSASFGALVGRLTGDVDATLSHNLFRMLPTDIASTEGIHIGLSGPAGGAHIATTLLLDANRFENPTAVIGGSGVTSFARPQDTTVLVATNNILRNLVVAFVADPTQGPTGLGGITDSTIVNNTIDGGQSGISSQIEDGTDVRLRAFNNLITNSRFSGISALFLGAGGSFLLADDYNGYFMNSGGNYSGISGGGPHDLDANPLYLDRAAGDFRLRGASPMVDSGTNGAPQLPAIDFAGNPRIINGTVDRGAFERGLGILDVPALGGPELALLALLLAGVALLRLRPARLR